MKIKLLTAATILLLLSGCFKDETWAPSTWTHHFNGPIVKTSLDLSALTNLQQIKLVDNIKASDINPLWNGPSFVPPISGLSSEDNPQVFELTEYFRAIHTDSLVVTVEFTNGYPINFLKGTDLVFRNEDNDEEIFRHSLRNNIEPEESYTFDIKILKNEDEPQKIESNIEFYVDNFSSSGSNGNIVDFTNASTDFSFTMKFISVLKLELYPDKEWSDTVYTSFSLFDENTTQQRIAEGTFTLKLSNGLPINGIAAVDILDENDNTLTTLFENELVILPATIDPQTTEVTEATKSELVIPLNFEKLDLFYKQSKLKIMYIMNTKGLGSEIILGESSSLKVRLIADVTVYVDEIEVE